MTHSTPSSSLAPPPIDSALALIEQELAPSRHRRHALLLVADVVVVGAIVGLWSTEPGPLPTRLHVAFATLVGIGAAWIGTLLWLRTRRAALADDRVALARAAVGASGAFVLVATGIALGRAETGAAWAIGSVGAGFLTLALLLLARATRQRALLRELRARLEATAH
jgi:hypothetical protein